MTSIEIKRGRLNYPPSRDSEVPLLCLSILFYEGVPLSVSIGLFRLSPFWGGAGVIIYQHYAILGFPGANQGMIPLKMGEGKKV